MIAGAILGLVLALGRSGGDLQLSQVQLLHLLQPQLTLATGAHPAAQCMRPESHIPQVLLLVMPVARSS